MNLKPLRNKWFLKPAFMLILASVAHADIVVLSKHGVDITFEEAYTVLRAPHQPFCL